MIENIKDDYNDLTSGGTELQLISIGFILMYLPDLIL